MKAVALALILALSLPALESRAAGRVSRILKFSGVPTSMAPALKKKFPFAFEREVTLAEVDEIVRFLYRSGNFSNVEAVERETENGGREIAVVASILRRVQKIGIKGNHAIASAEVKKILGLEQGQAFERKHLLAAAEEFRKLYESMGYHNARVEIDFELPNESEVGVNVTIEEGAPVRIAEAALDSPNPDLNEALAHFATALKGRIFTEDELLEFQRRVGDYLAAHHYLTARLSSPAVSYTPDRLKAKLTYTIENPWKFRFAYDGNVYFADWTLTEMLETERIAGASTSLAPGMADKIRRRYLDAGFANVEVKFEEKLDESKHQTMITFFVKEGPRVRIDKIQVSGNISRPEAYYAKFIKSAGSDLIGKGYFSRKDFEDSIKQLVTELQNQGYFRARIQASRVDFSQDKSKATIFLEIDEGPLTQVRQIRFEGVESFPKAQLLEVLKIKTGTALGLRELEESIAQLKNFYHAEGFLEMRITNEGEQNRIVSYNEGNTQATVEFQIYEGPRVRVGSVSIQGNQLTKDNVILREVTFKTGDVLTPEKIENTKFHLQKLDLFTNVSLRTLEEGTNISERTVIIQVAEANPGEIRLRGGITNERDYIAVRGMASYSYRNIYGTGRSVNLRLEPKYSLDPRVQYIENTITLSYLEPYILGDRNRGRVNLIRDVSLFSLDPSKQDPTQRYATLQDAITLGFLIERDLSKTVRMSYNLYSLSNQTQFVRQTGQITSTVNIAKTGPNLAYDSRDDRFLPSKGIYAYINLEYSDPLMGSSKDESQTIQFVKSTASATHYQPLCGRKDWVFVNQFRAGYLANLSSDQKSKAGVPVQEAFFLGGHSTIRGFNGDEFDTVPNKFDLFPTYMTRESTPDLNTFRVRADSYFGLVKAELWFPLFSGLGGTLFYDGGFVMINQPDVNIPIPYRDSAGVGLRLLTPVGPFNAEFGCKLNRRVLRTAAQTGAGDIIESPCKFNISIGAL